MRKWISHFKCQKNLLKYCIRSQSILRVANRTQYSNHQIDNAVKIQIYLTQSQCVSFNWLFHMIVRYDSLTLTKTRPTTIIIRHEKRVKRRNKYIQVFSITAYYPRLEYWIWVKISPSKHQIQILMEIWSRNLDQPIFKLR